MAVKKVKYLRSFLSKTTQVDVGYHKSEWADAQGLSEEDKKIRETLEYRFCFSKKDYMSIGFDEKFLYGFEISGHPQDEKDPLKNVPYQTEVNIRKAGSEDNLNDASDLEKFLKENQFRKE